MAAKSREDELTSALLLKLDERLTPADMRLLESCWAWCDIESEQPPVKLHQAMWLVHFKLLVTRVDKMDRVWVETTRLGRDLVRHVRKKVVCVKPATV
jgi:hypothetical protein